MFLADVIYVWFAIPRVIPRVICSSLLPLSLVFLPISRYYSVVLFSSFGSLTFPVMVIVEVVVKLFRWSRQQAGVSRLVVIESMPIFSSDLQSLAASGPFLWRGLCQLRCQYHTRVYISTYIDLVAHCPHAIRRRSYYIGRDGSSWWILFPEDAVSFILVSGCVVGLVKWGKGFPQLAII